MAEIDDLLEQLRAESERPDGVDAERIAARALASLDGAPSPSSVAKSRRRQVMAACLGAALLIGEGAGLLGATAAAAESSPLSPDYALGPAALFRGG
jgi:hypothetical protein